jgi:cytochrome b subunit of formate dehydrogenase
MKRDKADRTCLKCHSDEELTKKYGLAPDVAATYQDSYHGMAVSKGYDAAATCYDCHNAHYILSSTRAASTVNPENLKETCSQCHPGATAQFAQAYTHKSVMVMETPIEDIVKYIYLTLIAGVIGFMLIHNGLIIYAYLRQRRRERGGEPRGWRRFSRAEVIQHILLLTSFFTLVITGFALKFPDSWWVLALGGLGLTEASRGLIHRGAALVMVSLSIWHAIYLFVTPWGRAHFVALLPNLNDFKHAFENILANLRGKPRTIKYGFFDYAEKLEYWALVWGTIIMIVSGSILWFPTMLGDLTPVWFIKVAEAFHYWEAWLATLAIFIWHLFFTIFHPDDYPLNPAMFFSGKMDRHDWLHKHSGFAEKLEKELDAYNAGEIEEYELSRFAKLRVQDRERE